MLWSNLKSKGKNAHHGFSTSYSSLCGLKNVKVYFSLMILPDSFLPLPVTQYEFCFSWQSCFLKSLPWNNVTVTIIFRASFSLNLFDFVIFWGGNCDMKWLWWRLPSPCWLYNACFIWLSVLSNQLIINYTLITSFSFLLQYLRYNHLSVIYTLLHVM